MITAYTPSVSWILAVLNFAISDSVGLIPQFIILIIWSQPRKYRSREILWKTTIQIENLRFFEGPVSILNYFNYLLMNDRSLISFATQSWDQNTIRKFVILNYGLLKKAMIIRVFTFSWTAGDIFANTMKF